LISLAILAFRRGQNWTPIRGQTPTPEHTLRNLKRHGNMAARIRRAIQEYAADPTAHANNVTQLVGSSASRMRVGNYRVIFVETDAELSVVRVGPRGGVYDEGT
jgi:mRNA interferase RelE/StbE